ncbi:hypothetical protein PUNSTDRAFT_42565 [Punctularia strigosozonata HHB-11173 SS5]|uniref:uncharacterized protein n=1 Tax=Punctularia strigosozonata (strain HHB-11173) TaxID=741275 RepID=UPI0004417633|nr:uncharacterized protein PUNSTDRAFT_42565 [Punctularia strigosozonata HHB-11173 SS5]EIN11247.1 hypothetical protein PUNSTDRAFT_42565 [Punctularia strigosozonata HHB-11173 SS5]
MPDSDTPSVDAYAAEIVSLINGFNIDEAKHHLSRLRSDLDDRITQYRSTYIAEATDPVGYGVRLSFGKVLLERYLLFGDLPLLEESIVALRGLLASDVVRDHHPLIEDSLDALGDALSARYEHTTELDNALEAITHHQRSLDLRKANNLALYPALHGLGAAIHIRNYGDIPRPSFPLEEFRRAADLLNEALATLSPSDPRRLRTFSYLQRVYRDMSRRSSSYTLSYRAARDALVITSTEHPYHLLAVLAGARVLSIPWGNSTGTLPLYEGTPYRDCAKAVGYVSDLMAHINHPHYGSSLSRHVMWLSNIANADEFDGILSQARRAFEVCPKRSIPILNVSVGLIGALGDAYAASGQSEYVDEQIAVARVAVASQSRPGRRPFRPLLYNLASGLYNRYKSGGRADDLKEAVSIALDCVSPIAEAPNPGELLYMVLAGSLLIARYSLTQDIADVDAALDIGRRCIPVVPENNPEIYISVIAMALELRFKRVGNLDDLQEAIKLLRPLLHRLSLYQVRFTLDLLASLSRCLCLLARAVRGPEHAREALSFRQQARELIQSNDLRTSEYIRGCAQEHACLWMLVGDTRHLSESVRFFSEGAMNARFPLHSRFACAVEWSNACRDADPQIRSEALQCAVTLLPQAILFGNLRERLEALKQAPGIARDAAIHELSRSRTDVAVELLEQGRAVFWNRALNSRRRGQNLPNDVERRLTEIMRTIDLEAADDGQLLTRRKNLHVELEALLKEARSTPGYEHLLRTRPWRELSTVARDGPIVVLLANETCAVALIIQDAKPPRYITLPGIDACVLEDLNIDMHETLDNERRKRFNNGSSKRYQKMPPPTALKSRRGDSGLLSWKDILERLWDLVVCPIFETMELKVLISSLGSGTY